MFAFLCDPVALAPPALNLLPYNLAKMSKSTTLVKFRLDTVAIFLGCCLGFATLELTPPRLDGDAAQTSRDELPPKEAAKACMAAGEELEKGGHAEQAVFEYEKAQSHDPELKTVAHRLAAIYDAQGDARGAGRVPKGPAIGAEECRLAQRLRLLSLSPEELPRGGKLVPQGPGH